jgi:hypothetical protein
MRPGSSAPNVTMHKPWGFWSHWGISGTRGATLSFAPRRTSAMMRKDTSTMPRMMETRFRSIFTSAWRNVLSPCTIFLPSTLLMIHQNRYLVGTETRCGISVKHFNVWFHGNAFDQFQKIGGGYFRLGFVDQGQQSCLHYIRAKTAALQARRNSHKDVQIAFS